MFLRVAVFCLVAVCVQVLGYGASRFEHRAASQMPQVLRMEAERIVHHHSLFPPHLSEHGMGNPNLAHWSFGLSTVVTDEYVRLTSNKQSREGFLWNDVPVQLQSWKAYIGLRVHSAHSLGGDGMAMWLVERPSTSGGPVVATRASGFRGLGIIFDSFDNDHQRDNPAVTIVAKTDSPAGEMALDPATDYADAKVGGCTFDYRNSGKGNVVHAAVEYDGVRKQLTVKLATANNDMTCATVDNLELPAGYYFGLTAHTGEVADNHDVHWFVVTSDDPMDRSPTSDVVGANTVEGVDARVRAAERRGEGVPPPAHPLF
eukprot:CAMPEP_0174867024 /NCGR_PEP_ID=MMETSP1114-20130205/63218_1 /TAXON_ID=312471 /ORGANISM="Neobodo designis, Strain CCAP 1951/1" /LENGTH=315 /DNA_ID=CAMNT_0016102199 /DNA_START=38 /DNA_END=982 /DNA_ORIENTATION=+